jgi:hypothetical protein
MSEGLRGFLVFAKSEGVREEGEGENPSLNTHFFLTLWGALVMKGVE